MPHPKNRLKLTGDTHPPEVAYELDDDDVLETTEGDDADIGTARFVSADRRFAGTPGLNPEGAMSSMADSARANPLAALGIFLALGYVAAKILRR